MAYSRVLHSRMIYPLTILVCSCHCHLQFLPVSLLYIVSQHLRLQLARLLPRGRAIECAALSLILASDNCPAFRLMDSTDRVSID
jgi:hypothetical protein